MGWEYALAGLLTGLLVGMTGMGGAGSRVAQRSLARGQADSALGLDSLCLSTPTVTQKATDRALDS